MGKYGKDCHPIDDTIIRRMRFTYWITKATNILRICNIYCSSTATMVTRKRLNVTLYVHCQYGYFMSFSFKCQESGSKNEEQCHGSYIYMERAQIINSRVFTAGNKHF